MQNIWHVLDKAASDALADNIQVNSCGYDEVAAKTRVEDYFDEVLSKFDNCSRGTIELQPVGAVSGDMITIGVNNLVCSRQFGEEFSVEYPTSPEFEKIIEFSGASPACDIKITDVQSGIVEVEETV